MTLKALQNTGFFPLFFKLYSCVLSFELPSLVHSHVTYLSHFGPHVTSSLCPVIDDSGFYLTTDAPSELQQKSANAAATAEQRHITYHKVSQSHLPTPAGAERKRGGGGGGGGRLDSRGGRFGGYQQNKKGCSVPACPPSPPLSNTHLVITYGAKQSMKVPMKVLIFLVARCRRLFCSSRQRWRTLGTQTVQENQQDALRERPQSASEILIQDCE